MINSRQHNKIRDIPTIKIVTCPACSKPRLHKYANEDGTVNEPSQEFVEIRGSSRFLEVCKFCKIRYQKEDKKFIKENLRKLAQAMNQDNLPKDSDHTDFSLN